MPARATGEAGISREALAGLPVRHYEGPVHLVVTPTDLERALADIRQARAVGLDTETRPAFRKGESHLPALVQVATAGAVHLFPLRHAASHPALAEMLAAPHLVKAGIALAHDLRQLGRVFPFEPAGVLDLGHAARRHGLAQTGLRNLAGLLLGFRIAKGARTTNWAAPALTPAQVRYAATDAWACRELYLRLTELGWLAPGQEEPPAR